MSNSGWNSTKLTAKIILFLRTCLTQQKAKFNKNLQVYILLADKFWLGERPGRDLYFTCQLSSFRTSLFVTAALKSQCVGMGSKGREKHVQKEGHGRAAKHTHRVAPEFISFYPGPNHAVNTKTTGRMSYD